VSDEPEQPGGKGRAFEGLPATRPSSYGKFFLAAARDLLASSRLGAPEQTGELHSHRCEEEIPGSGACCKGTGATLAHSKSSRNI
jgi:hypothetical protein